MEILSKDVDKRINSMNYFLQSTVGEYLEFAEGIMNNNDLQRRRVKTSKTIYSLLKNDLIEGCIMPPLVLAYLGDDDISDLNSDELFELLKKEKERVIILDGLQRTYTLMDARDDVSNGKRDEFLNNKIRLELYVNINRIGVLYRMLTLNTGQTPMSTRHQLEMLYSDLLEKEISGVKLISDNEGKADPGSNEFVFKNAIDGFNSYMSRDELPMDRIDILENIKMLEKLSDETANQDLFKRFVEVYFEFFKCVKEITYGYSISEEELEKKEISTNIIGRSAEKIFASSQAMTGFGAAVGIMKDRKVIESIDDICTRIDELKERYPDGQSEWLLDLVGTISGLSKNAKKIGNDQRMFFVYFYRELFNKEGDSYLNFDEAIMNGYKKYKAQV